MKLNRLIMLFVSAWLLLAGTTVVAQQTLQDAQKLLDVEQFKNAKKILQNLVKTAPTAENLYHLGNYYLLVYEVDSVDEYIDTARMNFEMGLTKDAKFALNQVGMGTVKMFAKKKADAVSYFNNAREMTKNKDTEVLYRIAQGYTMFDYNDPVSAIEVLTKAMERDKKRVDLYLMRGDAFLMQNDGSRANTDYDEAIRLAPTSAKGYIRSGKVLIRARNYNGALELYKKGIEIDPTYTPAYRELGWLYYLAGRYKEAIDAYRKYIEKSDAGLDAKYQFAAFLFLNKDYMEAIDILRELDKVMNYAPIHRLLGYSYYEIKQCDDAAAQMEQFFKESAQAKVLSKDYEYLGKSYLCKPVGADTTKAIQNLTKFSQMDTTKAEKTLTDLAEMFYKQKKYTKSAEIYEELIKTKKDVNSNAFFKLGLSYYFAKTEATNILADTTFSKLLQLVPSSTQANLFKARAKVRLDPTSTNLKESGAAKFLAKPYYEKFLELMDKQQDKTKFTKDLVEACWFLSNYYLNGMKDKVKAEEMWTKALTYDPTNAQVTDILNVSKSAKDAKELLDIIKKQ
jgi:tetratricopeptide (TPR) repeat protein